MTFKTLNNLTVRVTIKDGDIYFNNAKVVEPNVLTNNGLVHMYVFRATRCGLWSCLTGFAALTPSSRRAPTAEILPILPPRPTSPTTPVRFRDWAQAWVLSLWRAWLFGRGWGRRRI
jgi:hypothetical protein